MRRQSDASTTADGQGLSNGGLLSYLIIPSMIAMLLINEGLAGLSLFLAISIKVILSIIVSAAFFGQVESLRLQFAKRKGKLTRIYARLTFLAYILIAAYQGHVFASVTLLVLWIYSLVIVETIRDLDSKSTKP